VQIEQAIFTSARTASGDGYQLVARSPGVTEEQSRELTIWGPSHDALCERRDERSSVNFQRLSCGTYCVSKTMEAGKEYSSRGGARIYTQFLLVPAGVLARFSNSPFAVLRAAWAKGMMTVHDQPPAVLEPFTLAGRSALVDEGLLAQLADQLGPDRVGRLISAAVSPGIQLIAGAVNYETLFGGLLNCFPVEFRTELTFTTGLRYSPRRPFHLAPITGDAAEKRQAARCEGVTVVDVSETVESVDVERGSWATYVAEAIRRDRLHNLANVLQHSPPGLTLSDLNELGEQSLGALGGQQVTVGTVADRECSTEASVAGADTQRVFRTDRPMGKQTGEWEVKIASAGKTEPLRTSSSTSESNSTLDSTRLAEQLESAICEVIDGTKGAMDEVVRLWKALSAQVKPEQLPARREQYLRYTLTLWHACGAASGRPERAIQSLDLLEVIFKPE
jgi:hypothetical protein